MSERKLDTKGRWRKRIVAFRVSDEEAEIINRLVSASGCTKQEYIIRKLTNHEVVVHGSVRTFKGLKIQLSYILEELKRIQKINPNHDELFDLVSVVIRTVATIEENENINAQERLEKYRRRRGVMKRV